MNEVGTEQCGNFPLALLLGATKPQALVLLRVGMKWISGLKGVALRWTFGIVQMGVMCEYTLPLAIALAAKRTFGAANARFGNY